MTEKERERVLVVMKEMQEFTLHGGKVEKEVVVFELEGMDAMQYRFFRALLANEERERERELATSLVREGMLKMTKGMLLQWLKSTDKGGE